MAKIDNQSEAAETQAKAYDSMTVAELEQESYRLNDAIQALRQQAIDVQNWLGKRNEAERISKLLGRDVQIIEIPSVAVPEDA